MSDMFNALGNRNQPQANPMQAIQQLKSNPAGFLKSRGFNIPNGVDTRNPQSIINSLVQSGQIGNNKVQQAMQMLANMKRF